MMSPYEVAIIGAGPAGCAAARLLASWGHRVLLLHRPAGAASTLAESIPPSCRKLFDACGVLTAIDAAGFYRTTGNTVWWGSNVARRELFADGVPGYQVERSRLDDLLRREAMAAGAEVREAIVTDPHELGARFILDCSGRSGVIARNGWRTAVSAHPRTVALVGAWTSEREWPGVDATHTLVESYDDGWVWSVPLSPRMRYVTAMIDPQRTQLARGRPPIDVYRSELHKAHNLAALMHDSTLERGPWGCDASWYASRKYASDSALLVGDAASFVDPLSSFGVKKALASAWLAAVAVHTALRRPEMAETALAFFAAREEEMARSLHAQSREQFETAAGEHRTSFWSDRLVDAELTNHGEPDVRVLRDDPRVQRAFDWLKVQPAVALRNGASLQLAPSPVVRGREIVVEDRLTSRECPGGLRFLRDVDLLGVLRLASAHDQVPALFAAYNNEHAPVALPDFLGALSVMVAFGLLEDSMASAG